ncbi:helix-turn-helix transcriptional regulator [Phytomonospora sp. NPDC050363]|uniref:helix-turn-helix domain-containing protein n=1 Tax=Phytomonospora sp. NPDC050363 TaxID=3155642 RepID=UPI0033DD0852
MPNDLVLRARMAAGLSQTELAALAGTSRPTLSAYEHGQKSPTLATAQRIIEAAGFELALEPRIRFTAVPIPRGHLIHVPNRLPRLPVRAAFATVVLPVHLNWSAPGRSFELADRRQRARVYEIVLREGTPADVCTYIDGALLMDLWHDLVLPRDVRAAWAPLINADVR